MTDSAMHKSEGKQRVQIVPLEVLFGVADVMDNVIKAGKYPEDDWRKGMSYKEILGSILRHLIKWSSPFHSDFDDDDGGTGLNHLDHALTCLMYLRWYTIYKPDFDDRYKGETKKRSTYTCPKCGMGADPTVGCLRCGYINGIRIKDNG